MAMPTLKMRRPNFYVSFVKRAGDVCTSLILLVLLSPLLLLLAVILWVHLQRNPIFLQQRIGKDATPFNILKFRTFRMDDDDNSVSLLGRLLRSMSLDELPQLFNILLGQMSFVGPRPLLPEYLEYYTEERRRRHEVTPGLTGLSQVLLGNSLDWDRRLACDVDYIDNLSFLQDLSILMKTGFALTKFREKSRLDGQLERFDDYVKRTR